MAGISDFSVCSHDAEFSLFGACFDCTALAHAASMSQKYDFMISFMVMHHEPRGFERREYLLRLFDAARGATRGEVPSRLDTEEGLPPSRYFRHEHNGISRRYRLQWVRGRGRRGGCFVLGLAQEYLWHGFDPINN